MRASYLLFIGLFFFNAACVEKQEVISAPAFLLDEETYIELYVELKLLDTIKQSVDSSQFDSTLKDRIYDHYGITEEVFLESHAYYQSKPAEHVARLEKASQLIEASIGSLNEN